ncbi:Tetratricopeptide repeat-containing protein [Sulfurivirga caldicuralii]|uniref:Tetratricopeptide repeat-containing protein n=1 Tax=Sulfurivirga caldicuralii TaxID=364032 RepID=A0A1N6HDV8_9GAMM|nr:tetratricopeptide repeat protein [Sulfurivirga caldicuralii]SIO18011.1 Tetratricopeptide repeat-containing protein [Sulfurivirga caldicuralii]
MRRWLILILAMSVLPVWADDLWQPYRQHDWVVAEKTLAGVENWRAQMAAGAAAYRLHAFERAMAYFRQAAWLAESDAQRAQALLNLGNTFYRLKRYAEAVETFQQALVYAPQWDKAQNNLKVAQNAYVHWLAQQKMRGSGEALGTQQVADNFAFAGGRKPKASQGGGGWSDNAGKPSKRNGQPLARTWGLETGSDSRIPPLMAPQAETLLADALTRSRWVEALRPTVRKLEDNQWALQQRLFEREENFPAAQKQPHAIEGAAPW